MIALDTETELITDAQPVPRLVCAQLSDGDTAEVIHHSDPALPALLLDVLSEPVALANAPFDLAVISKRYPDLEDAVWESLQRGRIKDVLTREKMIDLADGKGLKRPYGLADVVQRRCGVAIDKGEDTFRERYSELIDTPIAWWPAEAIVYAETDALATYAVWSEQMAKAIRIRSATGYDPFEDAGRQARGHWALDLISRHGVCTDARAVQSLDDALAKEETALCQALQQWGLVRANGSRDTKALRVLAELEGATMMTEGGKKPNKKTGKVSPPVLATGVDALSELELDDDHPLTLYLQYSSVMTTRSRVIKQLRPPILRTRFNELAENGRSTSSAPNLQNLPTDYTFQRLFKHSGNVPEGGFRECLIPREGNVFVIADWSKAELVTWAQVLLWLFGEDANTSALAKVLREGGDPHDSMARTIGEGFGIAPRRLAKIVNFAFMGGAGAMRARNEARAKYGIRLPLDAWQRLRTAWLRTWWGQRYLDTISAMQHGPDCDGETRCTDECTGLIDVVQFVSNRLRGSCGYTDAANSYFSGLAADAGKDCLWRLAVAMHREPASPLYGARQVLFVHDENVIECRRERADGVAAELESIMIDTYRKWCPDVPIKVEIGIRDRYGKI